MTTILTSGQAAHGAVSGVLTAGESPAPGENPGGYGLAGLLIEVLEWVGLPAGMCVLGVLITLAGASWMWGQAPKATGKERRRMR
ncbi:hypothetical protein [Streptomyces sp. NPDC002467]|uniref:hypothetical protein n=1 Tax=Streptomyces sp. NPDC002467 TaxID=3364647 RepID=UPI00367EDBD3